MEMNAPILLDLPPEVLSALRTKARNTGRSPSLEAARLLSQVLIGDAARTPVQAEERHDLLAPIRARLAADLAQATGWQDLQARLARHGFTFRERGGGLALYSTKTAARICKASELGWAYADLVRRFGAPFPGHSHTHVADRVLNGPARRSSRHPSLFPDPGTAWPSDDDDPILFEDE
ncbi:relaxase/mobilization nuclease domain-containing protein [Hasllibacter sp. MH4015]|uniref:relaxase/mobilization nuclease domain-containing protein n=1 Tax=Hasllibacter sp. MH4015 TaxID=2854029 RepID=UPI001CD5A6EA|nr:relaxase/mobilization nuclease domain-containing protein [Hasllibacter sp. MH4015]